MMAVVEGSFQSANQLFYESPTTERQSELSQEDDDLIIVMMILNTVVV